MLKFDDSDGQWYLLTLFIVSVLIICPILLPYASAFLLGIGGSFRG
jgi:hypothetical protein